VAGGSETRPLAFLRGQPSPFHPVPTGNRLHPAAVPL